MRAFILILFSCLPCLAQLNVQQPMFVSPSLTLPPEPESLGWYWVASDLTNGPVTGWKSRTGPALLSNETLASRPTKSGDEVIFDIAQSYFLTNKLEFTVSTNWSAWWVMRPYTNRYLGTYIWQNALSNTNAYGVALPQNDWFYGINLVISTSLGQRPPANEELCDVALVESGTNLIAYINGSPTKTNTSALVLTNEIRIGDSPIVGNDSCVFVLKELAIYTNNISAATITDLHNFRIATYGIGAETNLPYPLLSYHLNDNAGLICRDWSGNYEAIVSAACWDATNKNTAQWVAGVAGYAISNNISLADGMASVTNILYSNNQLSFTWWMRIDGTPAASSWCFFENGVSSLINSFMILYDSSTGKFIPQMTTYSSGAKYRQQRYDMVGDANWHHYAVLFDGNAAGSGNITYYLDGSVQTGTTNVTDFVAPSSGFASARLAMARRLDSSMPAAVTMDDIRLYPGILNSTQVNYIKNNPK